MGEYRIDRVIGTGGMGVVYRATHPLIGKVVAVKVLEGRLADDRTAVQRFTLEARAVNAVRHPNLVDIFSFSQLPDGRWYYVMEYLEGQTLGDRVRGRGRLPVGEALPIFWQVAEALEAVHGKRIVHRDLKPDNVFLVPAAEGPRVKLLDFGVAKLLEAGTWVTGPRTAHGSTVGTPHYMAPEQARGQAIDGRTDLYALGVMLYQTVTGVLPFDGDNPLEVCRAHVVEAPAPPRQRAPQAVGAALDLVIMKLLAKAPGARFQSAAEVKDALRPLLRGP